MFSLLLYFLVIVAGVRAASSDCNVSTKGAQGFDANFYSYDTGNSSGWDQNFFTSAYKTTLLKRITNVQTMNFQNSNQNIYGYNSPSPSYALELTAMFRPPYTGTYTFTLAANDGASLQIGVNQHCCGTFQRSAVGDFRLDVLGAKGTDGNMQTTKTGYVDFEANVWYPLKIVMFNSVGSDGLSLSAVGPGGQQVSDIAQYVYHPPITATCVPQNPSTTTTITQYWTQSYTTTETYGGTATIGTAIIKIPTSSPPPIRTTSAAHPPTTSNQTFLNSSTSSARASSKKTEITFSSDSVYTTTFASTASDGSETTESGIVIITTNSAGSLTTLTSVLPHGSSSATETEAPGSSASKSSASVTIPSDSVYTTTFASTASDGSETTESGIVIITTNSAGSLTTLTSVLPHGSSSATETEAPGSSASKSSASVTIPSDSVYTTTFASTASDGSETTESGIVIITTNSAGSLTTLTSVLPHGSSSATETDAPGSSASKPSASVTIPSDSVYTTTFASTASDGSETTESGIVIITTNSAGSLTTLTSVLPHGSSSATETDAPGSSASVTIPSDSVYTTTFASTASDGSETTESGIVIITTNSAGSLTTLTSVLPHGSSSATETDAPGSSASVTIPSDSVYTTTFASTASDGSETTESGIVIITTNSAGSLTTLTSVLPHGSWSATETEAPGSSASVTIPSDSVYTTTFASTASDGSETTESGIVIITTNSAGSLTTLTSVLPHGSSSATETDAPGSSASVTIPSDSVYTTTFASTASDGSETTESGIVIITTNSAGSLTTLTSVLPHGSSSETETEAPGSSASKSSASVTIPSDSVYTTTFASTASDGSETTESGIVIITTNSAGSLTTLTSVLPHGSSSATETEAPGSSASKSSASVTIPSDSVYTTTFASTASDGSETTESGIVIITTNSAGSLTTLTSVLPHGSSSATETDAPESSASKSSASVTIPSDSVYTTTFASTASDGSETTESGIVIITTNSAGSLTTLTSVLPHGSSSATETDAPGSSASKPSASVTIPSDSVYTTTFASTASDGSETTESGIVIITTNSAGSLTTLTSVLPHGSSSATETDAPGSSASKSSASVTIPSDSVYTTTFASTASDGSETTESGILSITAGLMSSVKDDHNRSFLMSTISVLGSSRGSGYFNSSTRAADGTVTVTLSSRIEVLTTSKVTEKTSEPLESSTGVLERSWDEQSHGEVTTAFTQTAGGSMTTTGPYSNDFYSSTVASSFTASNYDVLNSESRGLWESYGSESFIAGSGGSERTSHVSYTPTQVGGDSGLTTSRITGLADFSSKLSPSQPSSSVTSSSALSTAGIEASNTGVKKTASCALVVISVLALIA